MNEALQFTLLGAVITGVPLLAALVSVTLDKERWVRLAEKLEERQREVVRWLCEDCKGSGSFRQEGNVIRFTKKEK